MTRRLRSPLALLALLSLVSLAARVAFIGAPCRAPCRGARAHVLVFDEVYYVNAARAIAGVARPAGQHYVGTPAGDDPNSEHPQLVKLAIAGTIELFGDGPFAWRIGSLVMGSLALLGMYALARAAGAERRPAAVAAALLAADNLLLVHGRIGTLDIYVVTAMIWAVVLYLRRRPLAAGALLGVGAAAKEVAAYALVVLAVLEGARWWRERVGRRADERAGRPADRRTGGRADGRAAGWRLAGCAVAAAGAFVALLAVMDCVAPPYDDTAKRLVGGGVLGHLGHILSFASQQSSPRGPTGIASYPWEWLFDYKPIVYLNVNPSVPSRGLEHVHPAVHFLGVISPPMILLALPALVLAAWAGWAPGPPAGGLRGRPGRRLGAPAAGDWELGESAMVGLAWVLGTLGPFLVLSLIWRRTSYLYYMVVVMPGLYLALAALLVRARGHPRLLAGWVALAAIAVVIMYPLFPLP